MALEFLSKKRWNPSNLKNREQVWIREQAAEEEKRKIKELEKQIKEEKARTELRKAQMEATGEDISKNRRVDWMYEMPVAAGPSSDDYLTGKAVIDLYKNEKNQVKELETKEKAGSAFFDDNDDLMSTNEMMRRINEDPLMMIRKKEMEITSNRLANSQRLMKIAAMLKEKGSKISLDFNKMQEEEKGKKGRREERREARASRSESESSESESSESESSDNYLDKVGKKRERKPLVKRRHHHHHDRSRSRSRSGGRRSRRSRSGSGSRKDRRRSRSRSGSRRDRREQREQRSREDRSGKDRFGRDVKPELSAEDIEARVQAMKMDAMTQESDRKALVEEEEERKKNDRNRDGKMNRAPNFIAKMQYDSTVGDEANLKKRLENRMYYRS